jgi:hypothetical protein
MSKQFITIPKCNDWLAHSNYQNSNETQQIESWDQLKTKIALSDTWSQKKKEKEKEKQNLVQLVYLKYKFILFTDAT